MKTASALHRLCGLLAVMAAVASPAAQAADAAPGDTAAQVAEIAADAHVPRLTPDTIVARLQPLVALKADTATSEEWTFSGTSAATGVAWTRADFQAARKPGKWTFLQMQIGLVPRTGDRATLASAIVADLTRKLGKPRTPASGKAEHLSTWSVKGRSIAVHDGSFASPIDDAKQPVVLVEIAVDQGEAD